MKPNPLFVPWQQSNFWRQSFGWSRKRIASLLPRAKRATASECPENCPSLECIVRSFAVVFQRGGDQLVDILLMGWWWGKWESASATFWFQQVWVYALVGSIQFPSTWRGFQYLQNNSKILLCVSTEGEPRPWPTATPLFLSVLFHLVFDLSAYGMFVSTRDQTCTPCSGSSLDHEGSPATIVSWLFLLCPAPPPFPN